MLTSFFVEPNSQSKGNSSPEIQHKADAGKLDYIDALRGIAALSVFFYHLTTRITTLCYQDGQFPLQMIPYRFISLNLASIPLFFIISGFTLYLSLDNKSEEKRRFLKFYIRRFFRIAPLFYVLLIYVILNDLINQNRVPSWLEALANFTFTFNLIPQYSKSLIDAGWTVGVEMLFYLFLPLIFIKVNDIWRSIIFFIGVFWISKAYLPAMGMIIGEEVIAGADNYAYYNLSHWAFIFPVGIICYLIYKSYVPKIKGEYRVPISVVMLSLSMVILLGCIENPALYGLPEPLVELANIFLMSPIAFSLLILSLSLSSNRLIVNRITRFYGKISYSFYLDHLFLIVPLQPAYKYIYAHSILSTDLSFCLCLILTLLIVTPVSLLTYRLIESPGIRYGKWLIGLL